MHVQMQANEILLWSAGCTSSHGVMTQPCGLVVVVRVQVSTSTSTEVDWFNLYQSHFFLLHGNFTINAKRDDLIIHLLFRGCPTYTHSLDPGLQVARRVNLEVGLHLALEFMSNFTVIEEVL